MNIYPTKTILAHLADGRPDFYLKREPLVQVEMKAVEWLRKSGVEIIESPVLKSLKDIRDFAELHSCSGAQSLIIHLPIWANPIFSIKLHNFLDLPILLLGNDRPDTSSMVGILGAGGALSQIGVIHKRVFEHQSDDSHREVLAFIRAASVVKTLRGQTLGLFGGRSLGIFTAGADTAQWQKLFGVDIESLDQCEIVKIAEALPREEVQAQTDWFKSMLAGVDFDGKFNSKVLEKQVRSYIATKKLVAEYGFDFIGVKCQPELSDGYVTQCVSHCLMNSFFDADGEKLPFVHACESDADGALSMQILHLITGGGPSSLLDMRWFDSEKNQWVLANCGAVSSAFFATKGDPTGLAHLRMVPHVFGKGGGGALPGAIPPGEITLARLCRKDGNYWMAVVSGRTAKITREDLAKTTSAFPQAYIKANTDADFLNEFGSNHIHMVFGDFSRELSFFCEMVGIPCRIWK
jgi:L-fucose/D-arabinose isomerase